MTRPARETWLFKVELPADVDHGGRFMARLLKHLLRAWGVKCTAVLDAPPDAPKPSAKAADQAELRAAEVEVLRARLEEDKP